MLTVLKNSENRFYTSYVNAIDSFLYGLFDKEDDANMNTMNFMMKQLDDIIQNLPKISFSCSERITKFLFQRVRQVSLNSQTNHLSVELSILSHTQSDSITKTELMKRKYREIMECQAVRRWENVCSVVSSMDRSNYLYLMKEMIGNVVSLKLIIIVE